MIYKNVIIAIIGGRVPLLFATALSVLWIPSVSADEPAFGVKIFGGVTGIVQGALNNEGRFGGDRAEGSMSADLMLSVPIGEKGKFFLRLDIQQGEGLTTLPGLFTSPNGNATGPNNDIETFENSESLNINEVVYTHHFLDEIVEIALGHIDMTSHFDQNEFANKETFQFLAQAFNNNSALEWGGTVNFFGPGIVLKYEPVELFEISVGGFEGDGNYSDMFDHPFLIGQVEVEPAFGGLEGHYRIYGWGRWTPHCRDLTDPAAFSDCSLVETATRREVKRGNAGFGLSMDQWLSRAIGIFSRFGYQDEEVSQARAAFSIGLTISGSSFRRPHDVFGLAYGVLIPGDDYQQSTGLMEAEQYAEVYYKYVVSGNGVTSGFHLSPDVQVIAHPGGDGSTAPIVIYGLRAQASF